MDFCEFTRGSYLMNHCEHCGSKQSDFEMYEEFDGAFDPQNMEMASKIILYPVAEPFACDGNVESGLAAELLWSCYRSL